MYAAQYADPRQLAEMQSDLNTAEMFRKKADEWDKEHGLGYHLLTVGLILTTGLFGVLLALRRTNPYRSVAEGCYIRYRQTHDEIAKAHGLPTSKELDRYVLWGKRPAAWDKPAPPARRPAPSRATLAA